MNLEGTAISWPLRAWLVVEVMFGIAAVSAIGIDPTHTKTNFSWPISPVVMAALLGGFYVVSATIFLLPLFAKQWENVRVMILPAVLFTTVQLLVTIIHWDKFSVGTTPFNVWFASYVLPPPIFLGCYLWHQRKAVRRVDVARDEFVPPLRAALLVGGMLLVVAAILAFVFPQLLIRGFPWQLKPLTARSLCGWLMIVGALMVSMAHENSRTRCRLASPMLGLLFPVLLVQILRFRNQVDWSSLSLWLGFVLFGAISLCGAYLATGSWRQALS